MASELMIFTKGSLLLSVDVNSSRREGEEGINGVHTITLYSN